MAQTGMLDEEARRIKWEKRVEQTRKEYRDRLTSWLPKKSESREKEWATRQRPRRKWDALNSKNPYESIGCFNCYELASWYCDMCKIHYCKFEECKKVHEDEHTLSRIAGPEEN